MDLASTNPATGEQLRSFPALTEEALQARLAEAAEAFAAWRSAPVDHRARCLRKLAHLLGDESADLARTVTLETGKPIRWALAEVSRCADACRSHAENAAKMLAPEVLQAAPEHAYLQWSPVGVVLAVMPWQSPLWQPLRVVLPALLGGNAVLLKHARSVPQCALALERLIRRAGVPRGVFASLLMDDRHVENVLNNEAVRGVTVTGTQAEGRALAAQAGWLMKTCTLHLTGNNAVVVMPSADLDAAAQAVASAIGRGEWLAGRIVVHASAAAEFQHRLVPLLESLHVGDPLKPDTDAGPLGTHAALKTLVEQVDAAVAAGGRVLAGGSRMVGSGLFYEPTLLADVPRTAAVARDALSGPAAMLFRARDAADAIALANQPVAGSMASIWTRDPTEQQQLIAGVGAATVSLNGMPNDDAHPGTGQGPEQDRARVREFLAAKTVVISRQGQATR